MNDSLAPYNQSEQEKEYVVGCNAYLCKDAIVKTCSNPNDMKDVDWEDVFKSENHTPSQLIALFKECLGIMIENDIKWKGHNLKDLMNECKGWYEEEFKVEY